jgi:hypothetical protein
MKRRWRGSLSARSQDNLGKIQCELDKREIFPQRSAANFVENTRKTVYVHRKVSARILKGCTVANQLLVKPVSAGDENSAGWFFLEAIAKNLEVSQNR